MEIPEVKASEKPKKERKPTKNEIAYRVLRETGLNKSQATQQLGLSRSFGTLVERKSQQSYRDALESLAPKAIKSLKSLSQGKLVGEMQDIKGSDVNTACAAILDRAVPKQSTAETPTNTFIQINHNMFASPESDKQGELQPIDITGK